MTRIVVVAVAVGAVLLAIGPGQAAPTLPVLGRDGLPLPGSLLLPVRRPVLTQGFGCTSFELEPVAPHCPGGHFHAGLDLAVPLGTEVRSAAAGSVTFAAWTPDGYGLRIVVDHGRGLTTLYAHLEETVVAAGDTVASGQRIAFAGSTGNSSGPHLHFEVRSNGRPTDPEPLVAAIPSRGGSQ